MTLQEKVTAVLYVLFIVLFLVLLAIFIVKATRKRHGTRATTDEAEKFQDLPDTYEARLTVIDIFDRHLKRNPTPKEITHYSKYGTPEAIKEQILKNEKRTEKYQDKEGEDLSRIVKERRKRHNKSALTDRRPSLRRKVPEEEEDDSDSDDDNASEENPEEAEADTHVRIARDELTQVRDHLAQAQKIVEANA